MDEYLLLIEFVAVQRRDRCKSTNRCGDCGFFPLTSLFYMIYTMVGKENLLAKHLSCRTKCKDVQKRKKPCQIGQNGYNENICMLGIGGIILFSAYRCGLVKDEFTQKLFFNWRDLCLV